MSTTIQPGSRLIAVLFFFFKGAEMGQIERTIQKIKALPPTEKTLSDLFSLLAGQEEPDMELCRWIRKKARRLRTEGGLELVHRTYLYGGKYSFDDYMIACEWSRTPAARFWIPRRKVLEGQHHIASRIQAFLDDPYVIYLGLSMPPGTGKSTLIKFLLGYTAGRYPQSANMYVSFSDGMVKMMHDAVRAILTDTGEYAHNDIFPENGAPEVSAEYKTITYRGSGDFPTIGMVSLGGSVTGRTRANWLLITDDLVKNKEEARSPERLERLFQDYTATLTTRMIGDGVKQIQLGTIWSAYDPISRMKAAHENDPRYCFIAIPVWDEQERSNFLYGHPDRYTTEKIRQIKADLDPADFECLYMQHGVEKEGMAFSCDQLKYYNGVLPDGEPDNIVFTVDVAWGGGDSLSMPIAYVYGSDVYIHDWVFDRRDKFKTKPRVAAKILQHKCRMGRFEANNGGDEYKDNIHRMLREHHYSINLSQQRAPSTVSKLVRIEQHAPNIRTLYFRDEAHRDVDYKAAMRELNSFSFTAKNLHDDAPDSLAMLVDYLTGGIKSVQVFRRPF